MNVVGGSSEGSPVTVLAMLVGMLGTITYLLLTVIVLAALAGIAINAPLRPGLRPHSTFYLAPREQHHPGLWAPKTLSPLAAWMFMSQVVEP